MEVSTLIAIVPLAIAVGLVLLVARRVTSGEARPMDVAAALPVVIALLIATVLIGSFAGEDDPDDPIDPDDPDYPDYPASDGYLYAIYTDASGQEIQKVTASVDAGSMRRVSEVRTAEDMGASGIPSYWRFDAETGVGPFGSWYGAFNASDYDGTESETPVSYMPGKLAYRLDPYDLSTTLAGETLSGTYNVFLVVPTVYWKAEGNVLYMSSGAEYSYGGTTITGMTAYAHTATSDGETIVYPYIGIGVYEAYSDGTRLLSVPGQTPTASKTHDEFKALADALTPATGCDFQQWNFYQWTLFKMMAYSVMGTKNSQWMLGNGPVNNDSASTTGLADDSGPYADSTSDYDKIFIENSWGSFGELLGDAYSSYGVLCAGQSLGGAVLGGQAAISGATLAGTTSFKWVTASASSSEYWDIPTETGSYSTADDPTKMGVQTLINPTGDRGLNVGGRYTSGIGAGIGQMLGGSGTSASNDFTGARLSYFINDYAVGDDE